MALSGCLLLHDPLLSRCLLLLLDPGEFLRLELLVHRRRFVGRGARLFICLEEILLATWLQILEVSQQCEGLHGRDAAKRAEEGGVARLLLG